MEKTIEELLAERAMETGGQLAFGRTFGGSFAIEEDEYSELCKAFGRAKEGEGDKEKPSSEFKKERFITFIASDETVDSYGDILRVDGADLSRYKSGAAAFITSHDIRDVSGSSGVIVNAKKAKNVPGSPDGKAVLVTVYFPTAEEDPDADRIFKKYKAGTLRAVSVGFTPIEMYQPSSEAERKAMGLGKWGIEFRKWMPYELSAVTVGANPNALSMKGIGSPSYSELIETTKKLTKGFNDLQELVTETLAKTVNLSSQKPEEPVSLAKFLEQKPISFEATV